MASSADATSNPPPPFCGDDACDSGEDCASCAADCGPCNDTCATAETIPVESPQTIVGWTAHAADDYRQTNCGGQLRDDMVYTFTLTEPMGVEITAAPDGNYPLAIFIRAEDCENGESVACGTVQPAPPAQVDIATTLDPGVYFLFVDAGCCDLPTGSFEMTVDFVDACLHRICDDGNVCHTGSCHPTTKQCQYANKPNGAPCGALGLCFASQSCQAGECAGSDPLDCDDGDPYTEDLCDPDNGCYYAPSNDTCASARTLAFPSAVEGDTTAAADDYALPNCLSPGGADVVYRFVLDRARPVDVELELLESWSAVFYLVAGSCAGPVVDQLGCDFVAQTETGLISKFLLPGEYYVVVEGAASSAGSFRLSLSENDSSQCEFLDCNDGNPCTEDSCDDLTGCQNSPLSGAPCPDDGLYCTVNAHCDGGECVHDPNACDDQIACTIDACGEDERICHHELNDGACPDAGPCRIGNCVPVLGCTTVPPDCDDGIASTVDYCDPEFGCRHRAPGTCNDPTPIGGDYFLSATLAGRDDNVSDYGSGCETLADRNGVDAVFLLSAERGERFAILVEPNGFDAAAAILDACEDGRPCRAFGEFAGRQREGAMIFTAPDSRLFYLVVEALEALPEGVGEFALTVGSAPPDGDGEADGDEETENPTDGDSLESDDDLPDGDETPDGDAIGDGDRTPDGDEEAVPTDGDALDGDAETRPDGDDPDGDAPGDGDEPADGDAPADGDRPDGDLPADGDKAEPPEEGGGGGCRTPSGSMAGWLVFGLAALAARRRRQIP
ncbi:MAG: hypothetical protein C4523_10095 [Myxococcales bacterium]|nr:MAG: hypothetical protein C4523_10095 [Myxococcales bacterium]